MGLHVSIAWQPLLPQIILIVAGIVVLVTGAFLSEEQRGTSSVLAVLGLAAALVASLVTYYRSPDAHAAHMLRLDAYTAVFNVLFCIAGILTVLISQRFLDSEANVNGEYLSLVLFATTGMSVMAASIDLMTLFLGLELLSIALYILTGFARRQTASNEAALKYFVLGAFASGILLYGIALLFGATGSTSYAAISRSIQTGIGAAGPVFLIGAGMILVGLAFKVALVPFHMWTPDVYSGAPTPVTGFMAVGAKAAGFAALLRFLLTPLGSLAPQLAPSLGLLAILTMTVGNVTAIAQSNLKRMLAYSSIAHAGYILIAVVAGRPMGSAGMMFYLISYTFMTIGAFAVVAVLESSDAAPLTVYDLSGLAKRRPALAAGMAIFLLSLAGMPPTAGFLAKLYVFTAAVNQGLIGLAIWGVLNSVVAAYYYLRLIVHMYMREEDGYLQIPEMSMPLNAAVVCAAVVTLLLGLFPTGVLQILNHAATGLF